MRLTERSTHGSTIHGLFGLFTVAVKIVMINWKRSQLLHCNLKAAKLF